MRYSFVWHNMIIRVAAASLLVVLTLIIAAWLVGARSLTVDMSSIATVSGSNSTSEPFTHGAVVRAGIVPVRLLSVSARVPEGVQIVGQYVVLQGGNIGSIRADPRDRPEMFQVMALDGYRLAPHAFEAVAVTYSFQGVGRYVIDEVELRYRSLGMEHKLYIPIKAAVCVKETEIRADCPVPK